MSVAPISIYIKTCIYIVSHKKYHTFWDSFGNDRLSLVIISPLQSWEEEAGVKLATVELECSTLQLFIHISLNIYMSDDNYGHFSV